VNNNYKFDYKFVPCQVNLGTNWLYIKQVARGQPYWFSRLKLSCIIICQPLIIISGHVGSSSLGIRRRMVMGINQEAIRAIAFLQNRAGLSIVAARSLHDALAAVIHVQWFLSVIIKFSK